MSTLKMLAAKKITTMKPDLECLHFKKKYSLFFKNHTRATDQFCTTKRTTMIKTGTRTLLWDGKYDGIFWEYDGYLVDIRNRHLLKENMNIPAKKYDGNWIENTLVARGEISSCYKRFHFSILTSIKSCRTFWNPQI